MEPLDHCFPSDLRHLRRLTDAFGIIQHARREAPALEFGYALDDAARALIVVVETARLFPRQGGGRREEGNGLTLEELAEVFLRFIEYCQRPDGQFHNFVRGDRMFADAPGTGDWFGRTVWALGVTAVRGISEDHRSRAAALFRNTQARVPALRDLRAKAFSLLGLLAVLDDADSFRVRDAAATPVGDLIRACRATATPEWQWFEDALRYSNGLLPYALLTVAAHPTFQEQQRELATEARVIGLESLAFLEEISTVDGVPAPVGNRWYARGGERPLYDQQCVDAAAMVYATTAAFRLTGDDRYRKSAETWWGWFFGNNTKQRPLYRPEDGAVYDGLTLTGVNENRGAESVLAFLLAHLALAEAFCKKRAAA